MTKTPAKTKARKAAPTKRRKPAAKPARPVLITTEFRGVFFGYATDTSGDTVTLTKARNCIYWPSANGGFGGLATLGPVKGARIGAVVDKIDLRKVTSVAECTPIATAAWEAANVYVG
jgi:hypothetical protein